MHWPHLKTSFKIQILLCWNCGALHSLATCMLVIIFPLAIHFQSFTVLNCDFVPIFSHDTRTFLINSVFKDTYVDRLCGTVYKRGTLVSSWSGHRYLVCSFPISFGRSSHWSIHCWVALPKKKRGGIFQSCQRLVVHDSCDARGSAAPGENFQHHRRPSARGVQRWTESRRSCNAGTLWMVGWRRIDLQAIFASQSIPRGRFSKRGWFACCLWDCWRRL